MPPRFFELYARIEQSPNRDSRVFLAQEKDELGKRKAHLRWLSNSEDAVLLQRTVSLLAGELGRSGLGRVRMLVEPEALWKKAGTSRHHIGTTRMHRSPRLGVVDEQCRIHGVENLFVAGSSVFPTCGCFNPTLTIVAVTLRLAEHLRSVLKS